MDSINSLFAFVHFISVKGIRYKNKDKLSIKQGKIERKMHTDRKTKKNRETEKRQTNKQTNGQIEKQTNRKEAKQTKERNHH